MSQRTFAPNPYLELPPTLNPPFTPSPPTNWVMGNGDGTSLGMVKTKLIMLITRRRDGYETELFFLHSDPYLWTLLGHGDHKEIQTVIYQLFFAFAMFFHNL